jgi:hypothetical protein
MLDEQQIQNIIKSLDMKVYYRDQLSGKGDGTSKTYVRAYRYEQTARGKQKIFVDLGRIEQVAEMSQDELTETIKQKFAEKVRLKAAIAQQNQRKMVKKPGL